VVVLPAAPADADVRVRQQICWEVVIGLVKACLIYCMGVPALSLLEVPTNPIGAIFYVIGLHEILDG
jgi:hypothetical protein